MSQTKEQVKAQLIERLFPTRQPAPGVDLKPFDYHRLALLFALSTRGDLLADTFPFRGKPQPDKLLGANIGLDLKRVTTEDVLRLAPYREAFAAVQLAWLDLTDYKQPPCPDDGRLAQIVEVTKNIEEK